MEEARIENILKGSFDVLNENLILIEKIYKLEEKNKELEEKNKELEEKNKELEEKIKDLTYRPNGPGYELAKEHFDGLLLQTDRLDDSHPN